MRRNELRIGIIAQVALIFVAGVILTGGFTFLLQQLLSNHNVTDSIEVFAGEIADETKSAFMEYPAYEWLIEYWYTHDDEMDIEYDVDYETGTKTKEKERLFCERHPEISVEYATTEELEALPEEDQKLYAEIAYSWILTRLNQIKRAYHINFLFCILTGEPYNFQYFLMSASDEGAIRGHEYEQVYPLGTTSNVGESQQEAMRKAVVNSEHLADAGKYADYYSYMCTINRDTAMIGVTYDLSDIRASVMAHTLQGVVFAVVIQIILSVFCLFMLLLFVLNPLRKTQENILLYQKTKNGPKVRDNLASIRSSNEIGQLTNNVADLTEEIDNYLTEISKIAAEKERISVEISLASRIQANALPNTFPPFPDRKEFDIYASMKPAKGVGGDFYDFFLLDDDHLGLLIADVSGKGIPAALFMMVSMLVLRSSAEGVLSPAEILRDVNEKTCRRNPEEMFVSVWMGILEISSGKMKASNAGHEYPFIMEPDGNFRVLKDKHGFVIGGMPGMKYTEYEIQMEPGSRLFVYTDGLPEATNSEEEMFGLERIEAALNKHPESDPEMVLNHMNGAVNAFVKDAEQFDDLTMLCLEYRGAEQKKTDPEEEN